MTPEAVCHAGQPNQVANLGSGNRVAAGSTSVLVCPRDIPQLLTLNYPLPTIHYGDVAHALCHFSEKCAIAQIGMAHFGTQWHSSHGNPTIPLPKRTLPHV